MDEAAELKGDAAARGSGELPSPEPPRYLAVGRVVKPFGVRGWVKAEVWTDFPERFERPGRFFAGEERSPLQMERSRSLHGGILLKFAGFETPETAAALRDQVLYVPIEEAMPLPEGEWYLHQLIGLEVWTDEDERLGVVTDIWDTGSNDVYVVDRAGETLLLPAIPEVVLQIDPPNGRLLIHPMEGLLPEERSNNGQKRQPKVAGGFDNDIQS